MKRSDSVTRSVSAGPGRLVQGWTAAPLETRPNHVPSTVLKRRGVPRVSRSREAPLGVLGRVGGDGRIQIKRVVRCRPAGRGRVGGGDGAADGGRFGILSDQVSVQGVSQRTAAAAIQREAMGAASRPQLPQQRQP